MSSREDELERALIVATERIEELETLLRAHQIALEELRRPHGFLQD